MIGRRIEVIADLARVRVLCDGPTAADHDRIWAWRQTITSPAHLTAAAAQRRQRAAVLRQAAEPQVEQRCLADYDAAVGVTSGAAR